MNPGSIKRAGTRVLGYQLVFLSIYEHVPFEISVHPSALSVQCVVLFLISFLEISWENSGPGFLTTSGYQDTRVLVASLRAGSKHSSVWRADPTR